MQWEGTSVIIATVITRFYLLLFVYYLFLFIVVGPLPISIRLPLTNRVYRSTAVVTNERENVCSVVRGRIVNLIFLSVFLYTVRNIRRFFGFE